MKDWYPKIFEDVMNFSPIKGDDVFVAQLKSYDSSAGLRSDSDYQSLFIDEELIKNINPEEINVASNTSSYPIYSKDYVFEPYCYHFVSNSDGLRRVAPLVYSWEATNDIIFQPDPMFLLTYGLVPRLSKELIHWDDLSRPQTNIVLVKPNSNYDFPNYTEASVIINKDYLQDYTQLKKKTLIQVFCETRLIEHDEEVEELLNGANFFEKTTDTCHFRLQRIFTDKLHIEVTGYRVIQFDKEIPISKRSRVEKLHDWPDYNDKISRVNAKHRQYVYVRDEVLSKYEKNEIYEVDPESGGVRYKNQWAVSRTSRVGRNFIRIELFKLYEGTPTEVINHWNKYAVSKSEVDFSQSSIVSKSKKLVDWFLLFGESLASVLNESFETNFSSQDLISINREELNYKGWFNHPTIRPITNHLPSYFPKQDFLERTKRLHHFLIENLSEKQLRKIVAKVLQIDVSKFKKVESEVFRSIKLLNLILNYIKISKESGLDLKNDSIEIRKRMETDFEIIELINSLNSINSLRQLDSHKLGKKSGVQMEKSLEYLGIDSQKNGGNYLEPCELMYQSLGKKYYDWIYNYLIYH